MYQRELELAIRAAKAVGEILKKRENIFIDSADGKDLKLSTDKESERVIIDILRKESAHPVLSEECGSIGTEDQSGYRWIVDPLDGTVNYYKNIPELSCVSIALWNGDAPVLGVINRYAADELYWGVTGNGGYCNGIRIAPAQTENIKDAVIATGFPTCRDYSAESLHPFLRTVQRFKKVRMLGAAAIMGVFVAEGKVDAYYEDHIMLWDIAAAAAIVTAAGGAVQIQRMENNMCICKLFANQALMEDFYAAGL